MRCGVARALEGEFIPSWRTLFALPCKAGPEDHSAGADRMATYRGMFDRGGAWMGRMILDITVISLRRTVLQGTTVVARPLGEPSRGTLFAPLPIGGAGETTQVPIGGVNLDAPRPVVREIGAESLGQPQSVEEAFAQKRRPLVLEQPFPVQQTTPGPHDTEEIRVLAEARRGYYEWELFLHVLADGEPATVPIRRGQLPLRVAAPAEDHESVLREAAGRHRQPRRDR